MIFKDLLKEVVEVSDDGISATLMGFDGIPIANYAKGDTEIDVEALSVEYSHLISEATKLAQGMKAGNLTELLFTTERYKTIFRLIPGDYFITLLMGQDGNVGKGRFLLTKITPEVVNNL